jgi:hypothetical protein
MSLITKLNQNRVKLLVKTGKNNEFRDKTNQNHGIERHGQVQKFDWRNLRS